jgi:hypothetical protein
MLESTPSTFTLTQSKSSSSGNLLKLVIAGTVALTAAIIGTLYLYQGEIAHGLAFYGSNVDEKQAAFISFLAKYSKTYATKSDMNTRFQIFS